MPGWRDLTDGLAKRVHTIPVMPSSCIVRVNHPEIEVTSFLCSHCHINFAGRSFSERWGGGRVMYRTEDGQGRRGAITGRSPVPYPYPAALL